MSQDVQIGIGAKHQQKRLTSSPKHQECKRLHSTLERAVSSVLRARSVCSGFHAERR